MQNNDLKNTADHSLNSLQYQELFVLKCREIYHAEIKILDILALLHIVAKTDELKETIMAYYRSKGPQIERLQEIFLHLDSPIAGKNNPLTSNMLDFCTAIASQKKEIQDNEMAELLLELSHFFQREYLWLLTMGEQLEVEYVVPILDQNLMEEWRIFSRFKNSTGSTSTLPEERLFV